MPPPRVEVDAAGNMTLTSWAMLSLLVLAAATVTGSTVACEMKGRLDCLERASTAIGAIGLGGGLLFTHSPAEGAMTAARALLGRRRPDGQGESDPEPQDLESMLRQSFMAAIEAGEVSRVAPQDSPVMDDLPADPREIYASGGRG